MSKGIITLLGLLENGYVYRYYDLYTMHALCMRSTNRVTLPLCPFDPNEHLCVEHG